MRERDVEVLNIEYSPEIRGTIVQEEKFIAGTRESFTPSLLQRIMKRSSTKGQSSSPKKRRITRDSTATKAVHTIEENIETPILKP